MGWGQGLGGNEAFGLACVRQGMRALVGEKSWEDPKGPGPLGQHFAQGPKAEVGSELGRESGRAAEPW